MIPRKENKKQLLIDFTSADYEKIVQACEKDMRKPTQFIRKSAIDRASEVLT